MDRLSRQNINKAIDTSKWHFRIVRWIDIYRTVHPRKPEYTLFSIVPGTHWHRSYSQPEVLDPWATVHLLGTAGLSGGRVREASSVCTALLNTHITAGAPSPVRATVVFDSQQIEHNKCNALESSWNHLLHPVHENNCLARNWPLVPKRLETIVLDYKASLDKYQRI